MINPKRSEIWLVDLDPTQGQELQKTRPVVVAGLVVCVDFETTVDRSPSGDP